MVALGLEPLRGEGGYFRRSWTSTTHLRNGRPAGSSIWFFLTPGSFSALHRLRSEELWHFYAGDPVEHVQLDADRGILQVTVLGPHVLAGERPQLAVPAGAWQGARLRSGGKPRGWALLGCTLTPAWEQAEFELASATKLAREFPGEAQWIRALTR